MQAGARTPRGGWDLMVGAQIALSVVLVAGGRVFVQTVRNLTRADLGYDAQNLFHVEFAARTDWWRAAFDA